MNTSICHNQETFLVRLLQQTAGVDESKLNQLYEDVSTQNGVSIESLVTRSGLLSEREVAEAYANHYLLPVFDPPAESPPPIDPSVATLLPYEFCRDHHVVPLSDDGKTMEVAICTPDSLLLADDILAITHRHMRALFAPISVVDRITMSLYARQPNVDRRVNAKAAPDGNQSIGVFVIEVLRHAVERGASDIHLEPLKDRTRVRLRVGGILETFHAKSCPPIRSVVDYVKSRTKLDVFDRVTPQSGFFRLRKGEDHTRFRVRTCPIGNGEKVAIRLLNKNQAPLKLNELGFSETQLCDVQDTLAHSNGLVLVGGPARSGRRTTLYSCLQSLNEAHANIYTIEDSIHWNLDGAHQIQTREAEGFDIARALETCSGQDPDAILVQEISTPKVANCCAKVAMEGRLVFASIVSRDALSCISQLSEMGVHPTPLAHSLRMVISQRLVRKLCDCKTKHTIDPTHAVRWGIDQGAAIHQPAGCEQCRGTGFYGQRPVFEVLHINSRLQHMIQSGEPIEVIRRACLEGGTETLLQHARQCVLSGETSLEEIQRLDAHL